MKAYGISIVEGARITNVAVAAGESFPSNPDEGELFFRYDADPTVRGLHCFTGGTWDRVGSTDATPPPLFSTTFIFDPVISALPAEQAYAHLMAQPYFENATVDIDS